MASGTILVDHNESITVTAVTSNGVSILSQSCVKNGNVAVGWARFSTSATISEYGNLIQLPFTPAHGAAFPLFATNNIAIASQGIYVDADNPNLRASANLPSGTYCVYFTLVAR